VHSASYRDTFMLLLDFAQVKLAKSPAGLTLADITPELLLGFLDYLEHERHNAVRSRNTRLAALTNVLRSSQHTATSPHCMLLSEHWAFL